MRLATDRVGASRFHARHYIYLERSWPGGWQEGPR